MPAERRRSPTPRGLAGARVAALAGEQRGAISRAQLVALGMSTTTVDRRVDDGTLKPLWPGVYAYGHAALTRDGWLMASVLACGEGAHLAARAAAATRGLMVAWSTTDVITSRKRGLELPGIRAHRVLLRPKGARHRPRAAGHLAGAHCTGRRGKRKARPGRRAARSRPARGAVRPHRDARPPPSTTGLPRHEGPARGGRGARRRGHRVPFASGTPRPGPHPFGGGCPNRG